MPLNHFFDLAYDAPRWSATDSTAEWLQAWAGREFGAENADEVADIMNRYGMYAARRKYELLEPSTFSLINYNEGERVLNEWRTLVDDAEKVNKKLHPAERASFFEFVLHPCRAGYIVTDIYITAAKNDLHAGQRRTNTNNLADLALKLFNQDHVTMEEYHELLHGKWRPIMDQTHLGYNYWLVHALSLARSIY